MAESVAPSETALGGFGLFVAERFPFAVRAALEALESTGWAQARTEADIEALRAPFAAALAQRLAHLSADLPGETTPGVTAPARLAAAAAEITDACDGFLGRAAVRASLTPDERRDILRGMVLTRATDNRLKTFFTSGEVRYGDAPFQGK